MDLRGAYTALVTPFRNGKVDDAAYRRLLALQKRAGMTGVVPCGCTGEAATLDANERRMLIDIALETVGGSLRVIPGTGSNSTETSIELTRAAEASGADAAMLITPYYNKPSQQGLLGHYMRVAESTTLPLVLYNVPGRTGVTMSADTVARLYESGRFAAIKEAGGRVDAVSDFLSLSGITVLSGDDSLTVPMMSVGAMGVVSVVSNLYPAHVRALVDAATEGDYQKAREIHYQLLPVVRAAFVESNPSPIKAMLAMKEVIKEELRPPLAAVSDASRELIRAALDRTEKAGVAV
ncbi:MAG: 4-hydroxy-tetrahydrodipicolinate synthase [Candidatus Latescibacterota bacterium]|nr:MAG: 4-hydroxy-tetrahydrodipicolinate synthase [Candidatus Latescibacterota bacterium]